MKDCWAKQWGDCKDSITKEHIVSNSILLPTVKVRGFSWCKNESKEISASSFVSKVLCKHHNNLLSPTDSEIKHFIKVFDDFFRVEQKINKYGFSIKKIPYKYSINGLLIERWFVKTLINVSTVNHKESKIHIDKLLPKIFSNELFERPYGFSFCVRTGHIKVDGNTIEIRPLFDTSTEPHELVGGVFNFKGHRLIVLIPSTNNPIENNTLPLHPDDYDPKEWEGMNLNWHNEEISQSHKRGRKEYKTQAIKFTWN